MIIFTCPNCNHVKVLRDCTAAGVNIQCKCEAVYRVSIIVLREGKPLDYAKREAEFAVTYDSNHNRITLATLRDMQGQAAATQQRRSDNHTMSSDGGSPRDNSK